MTIPNQGVELAEKLSSSFQQEGGSDGLLGLAWPALNTVSPKQQATPVQNLINQGLIAEVCAFIDQIFFSFIFFGMGVDDRLTFFFKKPLFTVSLDRGDSNGFYTFGTVDATKAGVTDSA